MPEILEGRREDVLENAAKFLDNPAIVSRKIAIFSRRVYFSNRHSPVTVYRIPRQTQLELHRHEFFEIAVILSGTGTHLTSSIRHRITEGDVLFLHPRTAHGYEDTRSLNLLNILIRKDALSRLGREWADQPGFHMLFTLRPTSGEAALKRRLHLSPSELEQIEEWAARLEEMGSGERIPRRLEEAYLALIIDMLCRKYGKVVPREKESDKSTTKNSVRTSIRLGRLLSWIEASLACPLALSDLAAQAGMSERSLLRAFRSALGTSPHAYIRNLRLSRAAQRLADYPDESITEIALACGFGDSNYFIRSFHQFSGMPPKQYRRNQRA